MERQQSRAKGGFALSLHHASMPLLVPFPPFTLPLFYISFCSFPIVQLTLMPSRFPRLPLRLVVLLPTKRFTSSVRSDIMVLRKGFCQYAAKVKRPSRQDAVMLTEPPCWPRLSPSINLHPLSAAAVSVSLPKWAASDTPPLKAYRSGGSRPRC